MTKKEVLQKARELQVKFIRLQFTDILGVVKNVAIPLQQLEKALDNKIMFDGSSIEGFTRIEESDMNLRPVPESFTLFPWKPGGTQVARLICDVYTHEGEPFIGDPRYILRRVVEEAKTMGYSINIGPECEFFLFRFDEKGIPTTITHDQGGYFDLSPVDRGEDARRDIVLALNEMGFEVEASHHEVAPGQHEIGFKYTDPLLAADHVSTLKFVTRIIAQKHDLHATFMPKPIYGVNGSGMHTHISLYKDGKNAFFDPARPYQLSETALHFIGGLLAHVGAFTAVTNPLVNSYKRLVPGYEAPVYISWSATNRSALVRVPSSRDEGTRVEIRSPDPSCNPYLAFAVMIAAGLDGIKNKIQPPPSAQKNIYQMSATEREAEGIKNLPANLREALAQMEGDPLIRKILGEHIYQHFLHAKTIEWDLYRTQVHDWETRRYLGVF